MDPKGWFRRRLAIAVLLLLAAACAPGPSVTTPVPTAATPGPSAVLDGSAEDGTFRVTIHAERPTYRASEVIGISATLAYIGAAATVDALGSGNGLVGFGLRQLDGHLRMDPLWEQSCRTYPMKRDAVVAVPFAKSGGFIPTDPDGPFWQAFFADPVLHLPAGTWQIDAILDAYLGACGGEHHALTASVTVRVEP